MTESPRSKIIVALDTPVLDEALAVVRRLGPDVGAYKVGLEILTAEGSARVVQALHAEGARLFYDAKFSDIPNTVAGAARAVAAHGVWMFDVHASAGPKSIAAAVANKGGSLAIAVTVLTSMDDAEGRRVFGASPAEKVVQFARMAAEAGADGIVCSGAELAALRADPALKALRTVVPGVRPAWASAGDQARVMTPAEAVRAGASWLVIGRPILRPPTGIGDPLEALKRIADEIGEALA